MIDPARANRARWSVARRPDARRAAARQPAAVSVVSSSPPLSVLRNRNPTRRGINEEDNHRRQRDSIYGLLAAGDTSFRVRTADRDRHSREEGPELGREQERPQAHAPSRQEKENVITRHRA